MGDMIEKMGWHEALRYKIVLYLMKVKCASQDDIYDYLIDENFFKYKDDLYEFYDAIDELHNNSIVSYDSNDVTYKISIDNVWKFYYNYPSMRC